MIPPRRWLRFALCGLIEFGEWFYGYGLGDTAECYWKVFRALALTNSVLSLVNRAAIRSFGAIAFPLAWTIDAFTARQFASKPWQQKYHVFVD